MIGPTGVGKTEIARRLAALTGAPFVKVDATKYTEVGYYGRDVESMARDLVENAIGIVRAEERVKCAEEAKKAVEKRLVDLLYEKFEREKRKIDVVNDEEADAKNVEVVDAEIVDGNIDLEKPQVHESEPQQPSFEDLQKKFYDDMRKVSEEVHFDPSNPAKSVPEAFDAIAKIMFGGFPEKTTEPPKEEKIVPQAKATKQEDASKKKTSKNAKQRRRERIAALLAEGEYEEELIPVQEERRMSPIVMGGIGVESMADDLQSMLDNITPRRQTRRELPVSAARDILFEQETERLLDADKINERAIKLAEELGIIFIDEIDKIVGSEGGRGADVSRQGVQRDLLPIVEGTTIQTKYGLFSTEHVLFIAAGAFHRVKPSDLTPELQGRFPIRVELAELKKEDFVRILTEPKSALTKQYIALMKTENVELIFKDDAIETLAEYAAETNLTTQNIGARRLCTIMELLLEDLNFEAAEMESGRIEIDSEYVRSKIDKVVRDEDLSKFVL